MDLSGYGRGGKLVGVLSLEQSSCEAGHCGHELDTGWYTPSAQGANGSLQQVNSSNLIPIFVMTGDPLLYLSKKFRQLITVHRPKKKEGRAEVENKDSISS